MHGTHKFVRACASIVALTQQFVANMDSPPWTSDVDIAKELFREFEELRLQEESHSESVLVIHDYQTWEETQRSCRHERKVIALEVTNHFSRKWECVRPHFARLAKEFPSVCVRVVTGPAPSFVPLDKVLYYIKKAI